MVGFAGTAKSSGSGRRRMTPNANEKIDQAELDRYGIERVPADVFQWAGYRYSNAQDAVAAAKRSAKP
jgi:hypothetical protein